MRILFLIDAPWPTFRMDIAALFGRYLPKHGICTDLVAERGEGHEEWGGGTLHVYPRRRRRSARYVFGLIATLRVLLAGLGRRECDAIQVRGMPTHALFALVAARLSGRQLFYWMSFPQSEAQMFRARARGPRAGLRYFFPLIQGYVGRWLLYRLVLRRADHVFVQSQQMIRDVAAHGVDLCRLTAVPMGVDLAMTDPAVVPVSQDPRLRHRRVLVYLGTLGRARGIPILFEMLAIVRRQQPEVLLVLAGDTEDPEHKAGLRESARLCGVEEHLLWTGWLPTRDAWQYVRAAEVGLSPFPRGYLLDSASPTKAVEYLALGVPVVANDNPDQAEVIAASGGGLCVELTPEAMADAVLALLRDPHLRRTMADSGRAYVAKVRSYDAIASSLAATYARINRHANIRN